MGILTDYFIAPDDAAAAGALAQGPASAFRTVEGNGLEQPFTWEPLKRF